jgi:hypothetical protein
VILLVWIAFGGASFNSSPSDITSPARPWPLAVAWAVYYSKLGYEKVSSLIVLQAGYFVAFKRDERPLGTTLLEGTAIRGSEFLKTERVAVLSMIVVRETA